MPKLKPVIVKRLCQLLAERGYKFNYCKGINPPNTWEIHFTNIKDEMEWHIITCDTKVVDLWWLT